MLMKSGIIEANELVSGKEATAFTFLRRFGLAMGSSAAEVGLQLHSWKLIPVLLSFRLPVAALRRLLAWTCLPLTIGLRSHLHTLILLFWVASLGVRWKASYRPSL